jgi:uncharacterized protein with HEPN domain
MLHQRYPKVGFEQLVSVRDQLCRHPMISYYVLDKDMCQICCFPSFAVRYKLSVLGEVIYHYHDSVVGLLGNGIG